MKLRLVVLQSWMLPAELPVGIRVPRGFKDLSQCEPRPALPAKSPGKPGAQVPKVSLGRPAQTKASQPQAARLPTDPS